MQPTRMRGLNMKTIEYNGEKLKVINELENTIIVEFKGQRRVYSKKTKRIIHGNKPPRLTTNKFYKGSILGGF